MEQKATVGRVVRFVLNNGRARPATVVEDWTEGKTLNLSVQLDGSNDRDQDIPPGCSRQGPMHAWATSATEDPTGERPGSWHWPPRV